MGMDNLKAGRTIYLCELRRLPWRSLSFLVFKIRRRTTSALPPSGWTQEVAASLLHVLLVRPP